MAGGRKWGKAQGRRHTGNGRRDGGQETEGREGEGEIGKTVQRKVGID